MKVAVLGTGQVGLGIGKNIAKSGNTVKYGSRDPTSEKIKLLIKEEPGIEVGANADLVAWGDVILIATPSPSTEAEINATAELIKSAKGKPVLDATNWLDAMQTPIWSRGESAGEILQAAVGEEVPIYKAFNNLGVKHLADPAYLAGPGKLVMLYAGPAEHASVVDKVIQDSGFAPFRVGPIRYARHLEAIAELWIHLAVPPLPFTDVKIPGGDFHIQLLRKE